MFDLLILYPFALIVGLIVGAFSNPGNGTRNGAAAGAIITGGVWVAVALSAPEIPVSDSLAVVLLAAMWGAAFGAAGGWFGSTVKSAGRRRD